MAARPTADEPRLLLNRLAASADARHAIIQASRTAHAVRTYGGDMGWLIMFFDPRNRGLRQIAMPMLIIAIVTGAYTRVAALAYQSDECEDLESGRLAFGFVLSALSFLLVFRLNRAAVRHYEARQLCGWIMIHCRNTALSATTALSRSHLDLRDRLCELAVAFPVAFTLHIWGNSVTDRMKLYLDRRATETRVLTWGFGRTLT